MPLHFRRTVRLGPLRVHLTERGPSWSVKLGPLSWSSRARASRVDLPGGVSYRPRRRRW